MFGYRHFLPHSALNCRTRALNVYSETVILQYATVIISFSAAILRYSMLAKSFYRGDGADVRFVASYSAF